MEGLGFGGHLVLGDFVEGLAVNIVGDFSLLGADFGLLGQGVELDAIGSEALLGVLVDGLEIVLGS